MASRRKSIEEQAADRERGDAWPEPRELPTELLPVAPFHLELLPEALRAWVADIARRMSCAPDYVAVAAIVSAATLVGRRIGIRPKRRSDWTEYGNLWGLIVGRPGMGKSSAISEATRFLRTFEVAAATDYEAARKAHAAALALFELRQAESKKAASAALRKDRSASPTVLTDSDKPEEPQPKRYIVNDATVPALHEVMRGNPSGILALRDEVAGLLAKLDRDEYAEDRAFYLEAWSGNATFTLDRIGRGCNLSARINLSMLGGTQPGKIAEYVRAAVRGTASDDGLLQRFGLLVWPDGQAFKDVDEWPDSEARSTAREAFERVRHLDLERIKAEVDMFGGPDAVPFLRFADEAQGLFDEWLEGLMREVRSERLHPALESHLSKYRKLVPSLALVNHLLDGGTGPVAPLALGRALEWAEYLRTHAERLYGAVTTREVQAARAILRLIRSGGIEYAAPGMPEVTARDIYRRERAGLDRESVGEGLSLLVDYGHLVERTEATGGRPTTVYIINPRAMQ